MWKVLKSVELLKAGFFRLRFDECELPDKRVMPRYYVLEFPDWVNVVPVTPRGEVLLIEQYRHGVARTLLEIPGGSLHPGCEDPREAAMRELREETGHEATEWIDCGFHYPNPALQNNRMHTYLALGCHRVGEPELDPYEDIRLVPHTMAAALRAFEDGKFQHSLIAASFARAIGPLRARGLIPGGA